MHVIGMVPIYRHRQTTTQVARMNDAEFAAYVERIGLAGRVVAAIEHRDTGAG
jgi:hypothetical protein